MWRILLLLLIVLFGAQSPIASFPPGMFTNRNDPSATSSYVGPGDIQSGAIAWYGLRAYNNAYALPGTNKAINLNRLADSHTCDVLITSAGNLGLTANCSSGGDNGQTPLAWAGTVATCSGTISSTTLSCTGATATPSGVLYIAGTGIYGLQTTSCGTFTAGTGTCTLATPPASNIGTPETITFINIVTVVKWYDQSGNGYDLTMQSPNQVGLIPIGINGTLPTLHSGGTNFGVAITVGSQNLTYLVSLVGHLFSLSSQSDVLSNFDGIGNPNGPTLTYTAVNTIDIYGGTSLTRAASDLLPHAIQGMVNGASSVISVDGTETTGNAGTGGSSNFLCVGSEGGSCAGAAPLRGIIAEAGAWVATPNSTIRTSMCNNMRLYWGTAGSC